MKRNHRSKLRKGLSQNMNLVIFTAIFWLLSLSALWGFFGIPVTTFRHMTSGAVLVIGVTHGVRRYGWKHMLVWFGITFALAWGIEAFSIATGFPFGKFHYTDLLGAKLGSVPWGIMLAYFSTGYFAWTLGNLFLGNLSKGMGKRNLVLAPVISAFVMVMWNLCFDPIFSTIQQRWIWEDGGAYFGVPISNFLGWFLTMVLVYQLFALYLYKFGENKPTGQGKTYWLIAPIIYLGIALEYFLNPFYQTTNLEIYRSMALVAVFTMGFVSIISIIRVVQLKDTQLE